MDFRASREGAIKQLAERPLVKCEEKEIVRVLSTLNNRGLTPVKIAQGRQIKSPRDCTELTGTSQLSHQPPVNSR